jgi:hypothetical protein
MLLRRGVAVGVNLSCRTAMLITQLEVEGELRMTVAGFSNAKARAGYHKGLHTHGHFGCLTIGGVTWIKSAPLMRPLSAGGGREAGAAYASR